MTDIQARIDRELGRYALGFTPDFEEAGRLVSIIKELQAQLSEEQTTWKTTANVFCDRLGTNQKTDAEYIVAAINNLLTQLSAKEALIAELQKENQYIHSPKYMGETIEYDENLLCNVALEKNITEE